MDDQNDSLGALADRTVLNRPTHADFIEKTDSAIEWLRSHGVRINGTRLQALKARLLEEPGKTGPLRETPAETVSMLWSYAELHDIIEIHERLLMVTSPRF